MKTLHITFKIQFNKPEHYQTNLVPTSFKKISIFRFVSFSEKLKYIFSYLGHIKVYKEKFAKEEHEFLFRC